MIEQELVRSLWTNVWLPLHSTWSITHNVAVTGVGDERSPMLAAVDVGTGATAKATYKSRLKVNFSFDIVFSFDMSFLSCLML